MEIIFEWDARKARINLERHKVSFDEARTVFHDPLLVTHLDELNSNSEERFISIGMLEKERILLVVHTEREEKIDQIIIRIISCLKATKLERTAYEEHQ
jgi:uncharacterized DUF497 family protein